MALHASISNNHLTFDGKRYFRGGAEDVQIGAYGEKKKPVFGQNYLEVQGKIPASRFNVKEATEADIDWNKTTEGDFGTSVKYMTVKGAASVSYKSAKSAKLKLVKFVVNGENMRSAANDSPNILNNLSRYGGDARIAHQIFVAMEATLAETFTRGTSFDVSGSAEAVTITAKGQTGSSGGTTVTLSKGTTFAYLLLEPEWNDNKNRIVKVSDDQWGPA